MPPIRPELLDELLKDYQKPEDLLGQDGLLQQLTKALVERALTGELTRLSAQPCPASAIATRHDPGASMRQRMPPGGNVKVTVPSNDFSTVCSITSRPNPL